MEYEFIREIFNSCSGNLMRDVFVEELSIINTDEFTKKYLVGESVEVEKLTKDDGTIIYDVLKDGLRERLSFTPI